MLPKGIVIALILALALMPGAYGREISVHGGASSSSVDAKQAVSQIDETYSITDSAGRHAEIHAIVENGVNAYFELREADPVGIDAIEADPTTELDYSSGPVYLEYYLNSGEANHIKCSQSASTSAVPPSVFGQASAGIEIFSGSLINYVGCAYASTDASNSNVDACQSFDAAKGSRINIDEAASNAVGSAERCIKVSSGSIYGYNTDPDLYGGIEATTDSSYGLYVGGTSSFNSASGKKIEIYSEASRADGSTSSSDTVVSGSRKMDCVINGYEMVMAVDSDMEGEQVYAYAGQAFDSASGNAASVEHMSSDASGSEASSKASVSSGSLTYYNGGASTELGRSPDPANCPDWISVGAGQGFDAAGATITAKEEARSGSDYTATTATITSGKVTGTIGTVPGYDGYGYSGTDYEGAYNVVGSNIYSASAKKIDIKSGASDASGFASSTNTAISGSNAAGGNIKGAKYADTSGVMAAIPGLSTYAAIRHSSYESDSGTIMENTVEADHLIGSISGNTINIASSVTDGTGDKASTSTKLTSGSISGMESLSGGFSDGDYSSIVAMQQCYGTVKGGTLSLTAEAAKPGSKKSQKKTTTINRVNLAGDGTYEGVQAFFNIALFMGDTPELYQEIMTPLPDIFL